jgi:chromosome segregation ATPase
LKILILLHGTPPIAGRTVVGSGLRAFANGQALRGLGHEVLYCTRTEDLPADLLPGAADRRRTSEPGLDALSSDKPAPGVLPPPRVALGGLDDDVSTDSSIAAVRIPGDTTAPLAQPGGPLGSPGNPLSFTESHELHAVVRQADPDVVLVEAPEEARRLPDGRFIVILDMFAPRILEQQFQAGADEREAVRVLDALQRGDHFLFSNERQKYYHLPLLALAGVDCTKDAGAVVPISCPPELPPFDKPADPVFVAGGVFWPWADITDGLVDLFGILTEADAGAIHLYGGEYGIRSDTSRYSDPRSRLPQDDPRLVFCGMVPIDQLWSEYARGSVAFDLMAPNPEREINLSFRQVDYLRCGLPIITSPWQVIADDLREYGAGWLVEPGDVDALRALVARLLANPDEVARASSAAQRLASDRYVWTHTIGALQAFLAAPRRRRNKDSFVARVTRTQADLWEDHSENKRLREVLGHHRHDLSKKDEEVIKLNDRIGVLMGTVDRLTDSLSDVSSFKNEALAYLQEQEGATLREASELAREVERRALDLHKKQQALEKASREVEKLKLSVAELRTDNDSLLERYTAADRRALDLEQERDELRGRLSRAQGELANARSEAAHKGRALEEAEQRARASRTAADEARVLRDEIQGQLLSKMAAIDSLRIDLRKKTDALLEEQAEREADKADFDRRLQEAWANASKAATEARKKVDNLRDDLLRSEQRIDDLETDNAKGVRLLNESSLELARQEKDFLTKLEEAETTAQRALEDFKERTDLRIRDVWVDAQREADRARSEKEAKETELAGARKRIVDLESDLTRKDAALLETEHQRETLQQETERRVQDVWHAARKEIEKAENEREESEDALSKERFRARDLDTQLHATVEELTRHRATWDEREAGFHLALDRAEELARETLESSRTQIRARITALDEGRRTAEAELSAIRVRLEEAAFEQETLAAQAKKKDDELGLARAQRDRALSDLEQQHAAWEQREIEVQRVLDRAEEQARRSIEATAEQARLRADELKEDQRRIAGELAEARVRLEEVTFVRETVAAEAKKKDDELGLALKQRDQARTALDEARAALAEAKGRQDQLEFQLIDRDGALGMKAAELDAASKELAAALARLEELDFRRAALDGDLAKKDAELTAAQEELTALAAGLAEAASQQEALDVDVAKKAEELAGLQEARDALTAALDAAKLAAEAARGEAEAQAAAFGGQLEESRYELEQLRADLDAKIEALDAAQAQAGELAQVAGRLEEAEFEVESLQADLDKKNREIEELGRERDRVNEALVRERDAAAKKRRRPWG